MTIFNSQICHLIFKSKAGNDMTDLNAEQGFLSQNALDPKIFSNQSSSIKSEPFLITLQNRNES